MKSNKRETSPYYFKRQLTVSILILLTLVALNCSPFMLKGEQENGQSESNLNQTAPDSAKTSGHEGNRMRSIRNLTAYQMIFTTLPLSFAIIHLILFIYLRKLKANLYFAGFLLFYAVTIYFDYQFSLMNGEVQFLALLLISRASLAIQWIFALLFIYSLFYARLPVEFWYLSGLMAIGCLLTLFYTAPPDHNIHYKFMIPVVVLITVEFGRVLYRAVKQKHDGAWIVALGFSIFVMFNLFDTLMDTGISTVFQDMENPYAFGAIGFLITMSVYLARNYSSAHRQLLVQERSARDREIENRLLEADNLRKSKELEKARQLQLSMLPKCVDPMPGVDICFHMETATEVGGDYYDYQLDENGTVVLTIGDATGHGMNAGIMVAAIKSMFHSIGADPDIPAFFKKCSSTIKNMNMGNLFMGLAVMRIKDKSLTVASAGMPPLLIFRSQRKQVEVIRIKTPPLGGFPGYEYHMQEIELASDDIILAMSDGLPELFNDAGEMFGYARVLEVFRDAPHDNATKVVRHLCEMGESWRDNHEQEDDISFVVVKIK